MTRLVVLCRRLLAFVISLFTAACSSGPRTFVDVESGDVYMDAAEIDGLRGLLASAGLEPEQLGVDGELLSERDNWVEIDDGGHVWSLGLSEVPALDGLAPLSALSHLIRIRIRGAGLLDLSGLEGAEKLAHLEVVDSGLSRVAGLDGCRSLRVLDLRDNELSTLDGLPELPELRTLDLSGNRISEVGKAIAGRDRLESLDLSDNTLDSVVGLGELPRLERLGLSRNRLTSLAGLVGLPRLREVLLDGNRLTDAAALDDLPSLELANLEGNRLEDFPQLVSRLPGHLWQDNPGTRRYWSEKLDEEQQRERQPTLAAELPGGELDGSWSRGLCSWRGNRPSCSIRIPEVSGSGPVFLARFELGRLTEEPRRHPPTVRLQLTTGSGRARAYLARQSGGYPYIDVSAGEPGVMVGELFTSGQGVWFVLEILDGPARDVRYDIEPR